MHRLDSRLQSELLKKEIEEKHCFENAWSRVPELVTRESNFDLFLSAETGDVGRATCRLLSYWKSRTAIFGDRALRAMNLSGEGVLSNIEVAHFNLAFVACVENGFNDGTDFLLLDNTKLPEGCTFGGCMWLRLMFFALHSLRATDTLVSQGFVILCHLGSSLSNHNLAGLLSAYNFAVYSFVFKVRSIHVSFHSNESTISMLTQVNYATSGFVTLHDLTNDNGHGGQLSAAGFRLGSLPSFLSRKYFDDAGPVGKRRGKAVAETASATTAPPCPMDMLKEAALRVSEVPEKGNQRGLEQLEDTMQMLPCTQSDAYLKARTVCPDLVQAESDPKRFLEFDNNDPWAASRRLASYWTQRVHLFGDRAFLPLRKGEAIVGRDLQVLNSNSSRILPNDSRGHSVVFLDKSLYPSNGEIRRAENLRSSFAILTEVLKSEAQGFRMLVRFPKNGLASFDRHVFKRFMGLISNSFPLRLEDIQFASIFSGGSREWMMMQLTNDLGPFATKIANFEVCDSPTEMVISLEKHGFLREGIPTELGGTACCAIEPVPENVGSTHSFSKARFDEALEDIPVSEKKAYMEAISKAEKLVRDESNWLRFLQRENFNVWAATRRFVTYWEMRKKIFGDRAFLPMVLTGDGALTHDDIRVFDTGYLAILPNDSRGRPVVVYDPSRLDSHSDCKEKRIRCFFYILHVVMTAARQGADDGFVGIGLIDKAGFQRTKTLYHPQDLVQHALPVNFVWGHMVFRTTKQFSIERVLEFFIPVLGRLLRGKISNVTSHAGSSAEDLLEQLSPSGFSKNGLPTTLGGTWSYTTDFIRWKAGRVAKERDVYGLPTHGGKSKSALYSIRKREKQKKREEQMMNDVEILQMTKIRLLGEQTRLKELLANARAQVHHIESNPNTLHGDSSAFPGNLLESRNGANHTFGAAAHSGCHQTSTESRAIPQPTVRQPTSSSLIYGASVPPYLYQQTNWNQIDATRPQPQTPSLTIHFSSPHSTAQLDESHAPAAQAQVHNHAPSDSPHGFEAHATAPQTALMRHLTSLFSSHSNRNDT